MRFPYTFLLLFAVYFTGFTQIPSGYYNDAVGKKRAKLKTALHQKIKTANVLDYGGGDGKTWSGFVLTDVKSDGTVWDMYSTVVRNFNGNLSVSGLNIEHSFAKSWWGSTETQAYFDLHHLNPSDATANQRKSSFLISVIDSILTYDNGVIKVGKTKKKAGYLIPAWEPADEYKGDFARVYMYMVTAYEDYATLWTNDSEHLLDNNTYPVFEKWAIDLLLDWCRQDPVSTKEINRNNVVYSIQGNRNPYIDFPMMAEYVWGNRTTMPFSENGTISYPYLNYPDNNDSITAPVIYLQHSTTITIPVKANNLTGSLQLSLSGTNAADYRLTKTSLSKSEAELGYDLKVDVAGNSEGLKTVFLTISGGGITTTVVKLKTIISQEFVALPATNISSTGFNANWTIAIGATDYQLTVFSKRPTGVFVPEKRLEEEFLFALPNTWFREGYTDFATESTIRLASGSTYGKVILPAFDLSENGARITVKTRQYSSDNAAKLTFTVNNVQAAQWTTSTLNQTFTIDIPRNSTSTVLAFSAIAGKRLYVDYIKVEELVPVTEQINCGGYPVTVVSATTTSVSGLSPDSTYYYSVIPVGILNPEVSNAIKVHTDITTHSSGKSANSPVKYFVDGKRLHINNISNNTDIFIFDNAGRLFFKNRTAASSFEITLPSSGTFYIRLHSEKSWQMHKILCRG